MEADQHQNTRHEHCEKHPHPGNTGINKSRHKHCKQLTNCRDFKNK